MGIKHVGNNSQGKKQSWLMDKIFIQGRVFAPTFDEAVQEAIAALAKRNYKTVGDVAPYPCLIQPKADTVWWEYQCEIEVII